ncbi:MAG: hypothetical protein JO015_09900 [Verrucomicrobia bacterium]|nr:hypothetical protein [Verrucomicrobiota bacterium]
MAQPSSQQQKKRRQQLRDAQRRRRARLKEENKSFLQIILNEELLQLLRKHSARCGQPMHIAAAELLQTRLQQLERQAAAAGQPGSGEPDEPAFPAGQELLLYDGQLDLFNRT